MSCKPCKTPCEKVFRVNHGCLKLCNVHAHNMILYDGFLYEEGKFLHVLMTFYFALGFTQSKALATRHS
jgi:hypothetical protein